MTVKEVKLPPWIGNAFAVAVTLVVIWVFWSAFFGMLDGLVEMNKEKARFMLECLDTSPKPRCELEWTARP